MTPRYVHLFMVCVSRCNRRSSGIGLRYRICCKGVKGTRVTDDQKEQFEERAAIMEFDGGLPRVEAEKLALQDVGGNLSPKAIPECPQDERYGTKEAITVEAG